MLDMETHLKWPEIRIFHYGQSLSLPLPSRPSSPSFPYSLFSYPLPLFPPYSLPLGLQPPARFWGVLKLPQRVRVEDSLPLAGRA